MRRKTVLTYVVDEGSMIDYGNPTARGFIEVPVEMVNSPQVDALLAQTSRLVKERNAAYKSIEALREANRRMETDLHQAEAEVNKLSEELVCLRRIRANCEEKITQIDSIINPF